LYSTLNFYKSINLILKNLKINNKQKNIKIILQILHEKVIFINKYRKYLMKLTEIINNATLKNTIKKNAKIIFEY